MEQHRRLYVERVPLCILGRQCHDGVRDVIALSATIGFDMGLLAMAILNPPREPPSILP
jgi:hypothetical protein